MKRLNTCEVCRSYWTYEDRDWQPRANGRITGCRKGLADPTGPCPGFRRTWNLMKLLVAKLTTK